MKHVLTVAAVLEAATGLALLIVPELGDFSSAGGASIPYVNALSQAVAEATLGTFDYQRGLLAGSMAIGPRGLASLIVFSTAMALSPSILPPSLRDTS